MFFRREKLHVATFEERIASLKQSGFETRQVPSEGVLVTRGGCGAIVASKGDTVIMGNAGLVVADEIATLVHAGYQMFLRTPSGREYPALASQLKALHAFDEDLREALG